MVFNVELIKVLNKPSEIKDEGDTNYYMEIKPSVDLTWITAFETAYNSSKPNTWRSVKVTETTIGISCHHNELVKHHIPAIKRAIEAANASCKRMHEAYEANRQNALEKERMENQAKENILNSINNCIKE